MIRGNGPLLEPPYRSILILLFYSNPRQARLEKNGQIIALLFARVVVVGGRNYYTIVVVRERLPYYSSRAKLNFVQFSAGHPVSQSLKQSDSRIGRMVH
jgi:hypothetical protein